MRYTYTYYIPTTYLLSIHYNMVNRAVKNRTMYARFTNDYARCDSICFNGLQRNQNTHLLKWTPFENQQLKNHINNNDKKTYGETEKCTGVEGLNVEQ